MTMPLECAEVAPADSFAFPRELKARKLLRTLAYETAGAEGRTRSIQIGPYG